MKQKNYILSPQGQLFGHSEIIGFGSDDFYIIEIDRDVANKIIIDNHYSKKYYAASYIHLGVFINGDLLGVLQYGYAMNPASCGSVVKGTKIDEYLELNRMWLSDKAEKNSESKSISYSIKYIKKKFPKIKWIQSFADERCGMFGIVYQACSFKYYGEHLSKFWYLNGIIYHNSLMTRDPILSKSAKILQDNKDSAISEDLRQFRYIKFINKKSENDCLLKQKPYPKYYEEL
jgi:hypothetical protein